MMLRQLSFVLLLGATLMWTGCGSSDLSLLNSVKRFEPEWMDLSEKVTEMEDLLRRTHLRYESFLEFAGPQLSNPEANRRYDLSSARSQYRNIISERDRIEKEFGQQKGEFVKAVSEFNQWQNKLMQDKKSGEAAQSEFGDYQTRYRGLAESIEKLDADLTRNIEESNSMVRKVCNALGSARRDRYLIDPSRI